LRAPGGCCVSDQLEQLRERLARFASDREWDQFHSPKNLSMALIAEAAELVEHFQWLSEEESRNLPADKQEEVAMELADIFIFLIRIADKLGVDLADTAWQKIQVNETRYPVELTKGSAKRASEY
jgi:dCTP diphosphatase